MAEGRTPVNNADISASWLSSHGGNSIGAAASGTSSNFSSNSLSSAISWVKVTDGSFPWTYTTRNTSHKATYFLSSFQTTFILKLYLYTACLNFYFYKWQFRISFKTSYIDYCWCVFFWRKISPIYGIPSSRKTEKHFWHNGIKSSLWHHI